MRLQVPSLALLSGFRIRCCNELWCRWQMQLGSRAAGAVPVAGSCSSTSTPDLGTSICCGFGPKKKKKKERKGKERKEKEKKKSQPSYNSIAEKLKQSNEKMRGNLNRHFSTEGIHMANRSRKRYKTSLNHQGNANKNHNEIVSHTL